MHLLRTSIRMYTLAYATGICNADRVFQAHEKNRKYLQSLPSTSFPLEPTNDPAALPSGHITGKTGSTEPYQSNTGLPLEQR